MAWRGHVLWKIGVAQPEHGVARHALAPQVLQQRALPDPVAELGEDFVEIIEAVMHVVRRQPGASVMVAPGDGRPGSAVVRVSEAAGDVEITVLAATT